MMIQSIDVKRRGPYLRGGLSPTGLYDAPLAMQLDAERRRRLLYRALPVLGGVGLAALLIGLVAGGLGQSQEERAARDFARAWGRGDFQAMHRLLTPAARSRYPLEAFRAAYEDAAATATQARLQAGATAGERDGAVRLPVRVDTRVFGTIRDEVLLPVVEGRIDWRPSMAFPGLADGARLSRTTRPPPRARILSRGGRTLTAGPASRRSFPGGEVARSIAGTVEPPRTSAERDFLYSRGFRKTDPLGRTGLERAFEVELAGRPGGVLLGGGRVIARSSPRPGRPVRSTVDLALQKAAVSALGGRFGGIAALDPRTAEVRALAGIAFSAPQPPGSTFKLVTTTAALEAKAVRPSTRFPVETHAVIDGVELENANGESCGGSFSNSFAHSCNSVFAPLGVKLGAARLVKAAERYGFNQRPTIDGAAPSTIPQPAAITSPLELGATAIGQGKVLATPLALASVAQAIAAGGERREPKLRPGAAARAPVRVTSRRIARTLERLMVGAVRYGTGKSAAIGGVEVAGKTGTAELEDTRGPDANSKPSETDAWFTAYAPTRRPRIAVAVLLVRAGAGGETAAPAAKAVIQAALR